VKIRLVALVCAGTIALVACSSGGSKSAGRRVSAQPASSGKGGAQACSIVSQADASTLFGHPAGEIPDASGGIGASSTCIWKSDTDAGSTTKNVSYLLQVRVFPDTIHYSDQIAQTATKLDDVGDKAYVQSLGVIETVTLVHKGQTVTIAYSINGFGGSVHTEARSQRTELVALAKQAAGRM